MREGSSGLAASRVSVGYVPMFYPWGVRVVRIPCAVKAHRSWREVAAITSPSRKMAERAREPREPTLPLRPLQSSNGRSAERKRSRRLKDGVGRGREIRTPDFLLPKQALYQAELCPEIVLQPFEPARARPTCAASRPEGQAFDRRAPRVTSTAGRRKSGGGSCRPGSSRASRPCRRRSPARPAPGLATR